MNADKQFFTTFEVGDLCQVYHTTVINWINKGQLKAYTTPGRHRRIQRADLLAFMKKFNIRIPPGFEKAHKTVLAIDDDPAVLRVLQRAFAGIHQLRLQTTSNGVEALVLIGKSVPDLVILDIVMPEVDGYEVCRTLRSKPETKSIKIIVITGKKPSDEQGKFLKQNAEAVYSKPFSARALVDNVCTLLEVRTTAQ